MDILKELRGELEIIGYKNGKQFHYEKGPNTVTVFAKHATMHLLSGESFTSHGEQRLFDVDDATAHTSTDVGEGTNKDGTLISGEQYFSDNSSPDFDVASRWSRSTVDAQTVLGDTGDTDEVIKYPFFPTKLLFGTGVEFQNWATLGSTYPEYQQAYIDDGWDSTAFNANITNVGNDYSNEWTGSALQQKRTMNDIFAGTLTTPVIQDTDFGISGAIKDGLYEDASLSRGQLNAGGSGSGTIKTEFLDGNEFLVREWRGVGRPAFIYARRDSRFFQTGSEVQLSSDSYLENKITFTVVMPEQTGTEAGIFYPYNGYTLKVAGLFCDARILLQNTIPVGGGVDHPTEAENYNKMPYGMLFAKRYISPIAKDHNVSITARWTIYL